MLLTNDGGKIEGEVRQGLRHFSLTPMIVIKEEINCEPNNFVMISMTKLIMINGGLKDGSRSIK